MKIKLIIANRLSYYFCGSVAISISNTKTNPFEIELDSLTKQEIIGISRAVATGVIDALEGKEELVAKAKELTKKKGRSVIETEVTKEKTEAVTEEETKIVIEEVKEEVVEEVVEEAPKPTRKRTTSAKK